MKLAGAPLSAGLLPALTPRARVIQRLSNSALCATNLLKLPPIHGSWNGLPSRARSSLLLYYPFQRCARNGAADKRPGL